MEKFIWFIPLLPLIGFLINGFGRNTFSKTLIGIIGCSTILISFILSVMVFNGTPNGADATPLIYKGFDIINFKNYYIPFAFQIDALTSLFMLIITGVGFLIHLYSAAYMYEDESFGRFFAYLNLFIFFMLLLVMGNNFFVMFIGWEGVGLCSFLLIGFWFKNKEYVAASKKAFIMNRIGDVGFLLAMFWLMSYYGTLEYTVIFSKLSVLPAEAIIGITLLLFVAATGKSAQIPLFTWLPDAMAGPTPVSALIHAATMVTAGIFMISRCNELFSLAPTTQEIILWIGISTSLITGTIAIQQNDIKKVLAYSTVSQLGLMFASLGVGGYIAAVFHVMTHAFFKALLFLGAGSVIHGMHHEQDINKMGGLKKYMPITYWTFLIGCAAISAIPLLSGFFSKDMILYNLLVHNKIAYGLGIIISLLTAFYMFRLFALTFLGDLRTKDTHPHESPKLMTIPLIILAILSVIGGYVGIPALFMENGDKITSYLSGVIPIPHQQHTISHSIEWASVIGITIAIVAVIYYTIKKYTNHPETNAKGLMRVFANRWYIDEIYDKIVVQPLSAISHFFKKYVEKLGFDQFMQGIGIGAYQTGDKLTAIQNGNVGIYVLLMVISIITTIIIFFFAQ